MEKLDIRLTSFAEETTNRKLLFHDEELTDWGGSLKDSLRSDRAVSLVRYLVSSFSEGFTLHHFFFLTEVFKASGASG